MYVHSARVFENQLTLMALRSTDVPNSAKFCKNHIYVAQKFRHKFGKSYWLQVYALTEKEKLRFAIPESVRMEISINRALEITGSTVCMMKCTTFITNAMSAHLHRRRVRTRYCTTRIVCTVLLVASCKADLSVYHSQLVRGVFLAWFNWTIASCVRAAWVWRTSFDHAIRLFEYLFFFISMYINFTLSTKILSLYFYNMLRTI